jgi:hypothetical protein
MRTGHWKLETWIELAAVLLALLLVVLVPHLDWLAEWTHASTEVANAR